MPPTVWASAAAGTASPAITTSTRTRPRPKNVVVVVVMTGGLLRCVAIGPGTDLQAPVLTGLAFIDVLLLGPDHGHGRTLLVVDLRRVGRVGDVLVAELQADAVVPAAVGQDAVESRQSTAALVDELGNLLVLVHVGLGVLAFAAL